MLAWVSELGNARRRVKFEKVTKQLFTGIPFKMALSLWSKMLGETPSGQCKPSCNIPLFLYVDLQMQFIYWGYAGTFYSIQGIN